MSYLVNKIKRLDRKDILIISLSGWLIFSLSYYFINTPANSLDLHYDILEIETEGDIENMFLEGYESNLSKDEYKVLSKNDFFDYSRISSITLMESWDETIFISTSPGTQKLRILEVEILPEEVREFFWNLDYVDRTLQEAD